jgi:hypothetical protein
MAGFSFNDLFNLLREKERVLSPTNTESREYLFKKIRETYNGHHWDYLQYEEQVKAKILNFTLVLDNKWSQCNRTIKIFRQKNEKWLTTMFVLPPTSFLCSSQPGKRSSTGRPQKNFEECTDKVKRRKIDSIINSHSVSELTFAASSQLHKDGKRSAAILMKELVR